jgi:uncharacterized protein YecA (UPF0149 family)
MTDKESTKPIQPEDTQESGNEAIEQASPEAKTVKQYTRHERIGLCKCGSGKRFKHCCMVKVI